MTEKTCTLTEGEIIDLIRSYAAQLSDHYDEKHIDRINYFNRRLNAEIRTKEPQAKT